jgi:two-component sensor histidine kinase
MDLEPVSLNPDRSLLLTMALHELATNALKYGAWSNDAGEVKLASEPAHVGTNRIRLVWRETGGPSVSPPKHKGFGSRLIERSLRRELGDARFDFAPDGLVCTIELDITV